MEYERLVTKEFRKRGYSLDDIYLHPDEFSKAVVSWPGIEYFFNKNEFLFGMELDVTGDRISFNVIETPSKTQK